MLEILDPGPLTTVQDSGRPGWAHLGVGRSGAADRSAYALANRLVGNRPGAAALEVTFGGLRLRTSRACLIALSGAECVITVSDGPPVGHQQPVALPAGATVALSVPRHGVRTYVAVRGGIDAPADLGSRSTDLLSTIGPAPLQAGDILAVGDDPHTEVPTIVVPPPAPSDDPINVWPGPRHDWFDADSLAALVSSVYVVQTTSNRIGVRLAGRAMVRVVDRELPSEGVVEGAIQVPADGQPLIFLADHPVTGGYPVIAIVDPGDLGRIAQARPSDTLRFRWR